LNGLIGGRISHYRIFEQIGQGGMSTVFRGTDLLDGRPVAIKVLSPVIAHEERFQARFALEVDLLRRLNHPNIVPILDSGEADGLPFIVMPYLVHGTLSDRLHQGHLPAPLVARIADQLASALMLAHRSGVVHRDIKPSNLLLDDDGNILLSDFSFARTQDASQNLTGSALIGTPAYMSPEQFRGDRIDARSDQYSFGVVLFQLTTGSLPFSGDTPMAIALQHLNVPLPRPRQLNPDVSEEVEMVLVKALAKEPGLRFRSVEALNHAFQTALAAPLDSGRGAALDDKSAAGERMLAMYRKYQHVEPAARRRRFARREVFAALLLLLACSVLVGAFAITNPRIFGPSAASTTLGEGAVSATIGAAILTANPTARPPTLLTEELQTAISAAITKAVDATLTAAVLQGGLPAVPSVTATPVPGG
jgi:hypothetical protein